ncbi:hypothetical protein H1D32_07775 [Anaerobacillus sp. CMMVII]|uniref:SGNH/GDSL hydrolase family protein n=1 Tax=Anaerobacillus sp. CMMVII TaxID=2755588 RepID=UPI0021B7027B|nr:GDSL-type esterase/lipase family protein [Anaerobacillus sp. CMMVII]MCT8137661.1 hypothetical protein [Anaerobacillus sp. CMMVII]
MKRIVHLFLIMVLISSMFASMVSANEDLEKLSLVALGDSITFGHNLANPASEAFPNYIGQGLFDVTNLAYPGWTSSQLLEALLSNPAYTSSLKEADLITLNIGNNDLLQATEFGKIVTGQKELNPVELAQAVELASVQIAQNLEQIFGIIRSQSEAPILFYNIYNPTVPGPTEFEQTFYYLAGQMAQLVNEEVIHKFHSPDYGIFVLDAFSAYEGKQAQYLLPQDIHPNLEGHYVLADLANALLAELLQPPVDAELILELTASTTEETTGPVTISVSANYELVVAMWLAGDKNVTEFATEGNEFVGEFEVTKNGTYTVFGLTAEGLVGIGYITIENIVEEEPVVEEPIEEEPVVEEPIEEEPVEEEPIEEEQPVEEKVTPPAKEDKKLGSGNKLPNTATPLYNYLLLGFGLLLIGSLSMYAQHRKKSNF